MKFRLKTANSIYRDDAQVEKLKALGFSFQKRHGDFYIDDWPSDVLPEINIDTLEELIAFADEWGDLVFSIKPLNEIIIYDGYLE